MLYANRPIATCSALSGSHACPRLIAPSPATPISPNRSFVSSRAAQQGRSLKKNFVCRRRARPGGRGRLAPRWFRISVQPMPPDPLRPQGRARGVAGRRDHHGPRPRGGELRQGAGGDRLSRQRAGRLLHRRYRRHHDISTPRWRNGSGSTFPRSPAARSSWPRSCRPTARR